jgi:hypothetical protein
MAQSKNRKHKFKPTVEEFLSEFPPETGKLAQKLREMIKQTIPEVEESVYPGWRLIGYKQITGRKKTYFCFIAPCKDHVQLGFEYGVLLPDPHQLLKGNTRQVKHVPVIAVEDIRPREFSELITAAAAVARLPKIKKMQLLLERGETPEKKKPDS